MPRPFLKSIIYIAMLSVPFVDIHFDLMMLPDYGVDKYDIGTGFGHFGIAVEDVSSGS